VVEFRANLPNDSRVIRVLNIVAIGGAEGAIQVPGAAQPEGQRKWYKNNCLNGDKSGRLDLYEWSRGPLNTKIKRDARCGEILKMEFLCLEGNLRNL
jgi:hypothetical protein